MILVFLAVIIPVPAKILLVISSTFPSGYGNSFVDVSFRYGIFSEDKYNVFYGISS